MALQGDFRYPGITAVLSGHAVCAQGISPGLADIVVPANAPLAPAEVGDLSITDGSQTVTWRNCRVADVAFSTNGGRPVARILLQDARWKWHGGKISGRYNVPAEYRQTVPILEEMAPRQGNQNYTQVPIPPGEEPIRPETAKTARELCELCLKAMGVQQYDASQIDDKAYPSAEWDAANPAVAMQELAERYGCRVVFRPDDESVTLCREGIGAELPDGPLMLDAPDLKPKPRPKKLVVLTAPIKDQQRFALEPVGEDFDGSIKHIDQLSYKPVAGWPAAGMPPTFNGLIGQDFNPGLPGQRTVFDAQALASRWVYRAYRVALTAANGKGVLRVPANGGEKDRVDYHKQIILLPMQAEVGRDDINRRSPAPAKVFGRHTPPPNRINVFGANGVGVKNPIQTYEQTTKQTEVLVPFDVDAEHCLIVLSEYLYAFKNGEVHPAEIVLQTACYTADRETWQIRRHEFSRDVPGGLDDKPFYTIRDDVFYIRGATYDDDNGLSTSWTNRPEVQPRADYYLAGELAKLVPDAGRTRTYCGIVPVWPDGAIQQVTWEIGPSNSQPATTASRNTEHSVYLPPYQGRRQQEAADLRLNRRRPADDTEKLRAGMRQLGFDVGV